MSFHQKNREKNFFCECNSSGINFTLAFPLHEKTELKLLNIENLDATHSVPI